MSFVYFVVCSYGLTQILAFAKVFDFIRPKHHFFSCPMCIGFWVGVFLCGINGWTELFTFEHSFANYFILGCLSSGTSYVFNMMFGDRGLNIQLSGEENAKN